MRSTWNPNIFGSLKLLKWNIASQNFLGAWQNAVDSLQPSNWDHVTYITTVRWQTCEMSIWLLYIMFSNFSLVLENYKNYKCWFHGKITDKKDLKKNLICIVTQAKH